MVSTVSAVSPFSASVAVAQLGDGTTSDPLAAGADLGAATLSADATLDYNFLALLASGDATIAVSAADGGDLVGEIAAIRISIDNGDLYQNVDRSAPYALFGDKKGDLWGGLILDQEPHTLHIEVYSENNLKDSALLFDYTVDFQVSAGAIEGWELMV